MVAEIEQNKAENPCLIYTYKVSPFSTEALAVLDASGNVYSRSLLAGLFWHTLGLFWYVVGLFWQVSSGIRYVSSGM